MSNKRVYILPNILSGKRLNGFITMLSDPMFYRLHKKVLLKFAFIASLILAALSILTAQLLRAVNTQADAFVTETSQNFNLKTEPLASYTPAAEATLSPIVSSAASNSTTGSSNNSQVQVVINGENIAVPQNGRVHRDIQNEGGQTSVDVVVQDGQITTSSQTQNNGAFSSSFTSSNSYSSSQQYNNGAP